MSEDMKLSKVVIHYADQRISELEVANAALKADRDQWERACRGRAAEHEQHLKDKLALKTENAKLRAVVDAVVAGKRAFQYLEHDWAAVEKALNELETK